MNRQQALARAREVFCALPAGDTALESELLLRHTLGIDRVQLYLDIFRELSPEQESSYWRLVQRRLSGEPSQYITGNREFYGIDFYVDSRVLIPRPESELLVERAIALASSSGTTAIADIGTGCGALAISMALHLPHAGIYATDISLEALEVAAINRSRYGLDERVCLLQGDMLEPIPASVELIVSNMPYVRRAYLPLNSAEPLLALDGGEDGLTKIERLCRQAREKPNATKCLLLEVGEGQAGPVKDLLLELFPAAGIDVYHDLAGIERVVGLRLTA
jgi:release factor glutamine methyltransferase